MGFHLSSSLVVYFVRSKELWQDAWFSVSRVEIKELILRVRFKSIWGTFGFYSGTGMTRVQHSIYHKSSPAMTLYLRQYLKLQVPFQVAFVNPRVKTNSSIQWN